MTRLLGALTLAACLTGGVAAARAEGFLSPGRIQLAQMNSPGDGLDGRQAVRQGNARRPDGRTQDAASPPAPLSPRAPR